MAKAAWGGLPEPRDERADFRSTGDERAKEHQAAIAFVGLVSFGLLQARRR